MVLRAALVAAGTSAVTATAWDDLKGILERFPGGLYPALLTLATAIALLRFLTRRKAAEWFRRQLPGRLPEIARRLRLPQVWALWVSLTIGVAVFLAFWGTVQGAGVLMRTISPPPCDPPMELLVVIAPENVPVLRERADEYTTANLVDGCATRRISVAAAPSITDMNHGFKNKWERDYQRHDDEPFVRLLSQRPDAWIAVSTEEKNLATQDVTEQMATFTSTGGVARDELVIAMVRKRLDDLRRLHPSSDDLTQVIRERLDMRVVYPQPGLSTAGLIAVATLARGDTGQQIVESTGFGDTTSDVLCRFGSADPATRETFALIIPSHTIEGYNKGSSGCPNTPSHGESRLEAVPAPPIATMDHPFVRIAWAGDDDPARQAALTHFGAWLAENPLFGDPGPAGDRTALGLAATRAVLDGKLPPLRLQIMLDGSKSMSEHLALSVRTREAFPVVKRTLVPADELRLGWFYTDEKKTRVRISPTSSSTDLDQMIQEIGPFYGGDGRVSEMIREMGGRISRPGRSMAVITDGGPFDNDEGNDDPSGPVLKALADTPTVENLYLLVLGETGCPARLASERTLATGQRVVCVPAGTDLEKALTRMISTTRNWS
ncbi:hypothetical protein [Herbidospora sp. RD11066]